MFWIIVWKRASWLSLKNSNIRRTCLQLNILQKLLRAKWKWKVRFFFRGTQFTAFCRKSRKTWITEVHKWNVPGCFNQFISTVTMILTEVQTLKPSILQNFKPPQDYPEWMLLLGFGCCVAFLVAGLPGNIITILALARCKKVTTTTIITITTITTTITIFFAFFPALMPS